MTPLLVAASSSSSWLVYVMNGWMLGQDTSARHSGKMRTAAERWLSQAAAAPVSAAIKTIEFKLMNKSILVEIIFHKCVDSFAKLSQYLNVKQIQL